MNKKSQRSLGGEEHQVTTGGDGSSPSVATKSQRRRWHAQLRRLDKKLSWFDLMFSERDWLFIKTHKNLVELDQKRRKIRLKLKGYKV